MFISFLLIIIMIFLVINSSLVYMGAVSGLMLWYNNVLPFILPFMLIANYLVYNSLENKKINETRTGIIPFFTILLGCMCGCPVGARCTAIYTKSKKYPASIGNIILPLCNNFSPIFISGYISYKIFNSCLPLTLIFFLIYFPYVFLAILRMSIYKLSDNKKCKKNKTFALSTENKIKASNSTDYSIMYSTIYQTACVGIYIMLCSIIIYIIQATNLSYTCKLLLSALTEVTNGSQLLSCSPILSQEKKIALILSFASFGGLSSILQTKSAISDSGLSFIKYFISKIACAAITYFLTILLI